MLEPGPFQLPASDNTLGADGELLQAASANPVASTTTGSHDFMMRSSIKP